MSELPKVFSEYMVDTALSRLFGSELYIDRNHPCDSPIERLFLIAFFLVGTDEGGVMFGEPASNEPSDSWFFVLKQAPVRRELPLNLRNTTFANYRADFVIGLVEFPNARRVVVECDGHDYHERTKEQAAHDRQRDRDMQAAGYTVFRFTGSELFRDAIKCAREVVAELFSIHIRASENAS